MSCVGSLLIPVLVDKILDMSDSFPAAFTRETGLHRRPVMVT
jgi:hypothetical protein